MNSAIYGKLKPLLLLFFFLNVPNPAIIHYQIVIIVPFFHFHTEPTSCCGSRKKIIIGNK